MTKLDIRRFPSPTYVARCEQVQVGLGLLERLFRPETARVSRPALATLALPITVRRAARYALGQPLRTCWTPRRRRWSSRRRSRGPTARPSGRQAEHRAEQSSDAPTVTNTMSAARVRRGLGDGGPRPPVARPWPGPVVDRQIASRGQQSQRQRGSIRPYPASQPVRQVCPVIGTPGSPHAPPLLVTLRPGLTARN